MHHKDLQKSVRLPFYPLIKLYFSSEKRLKSLYNTAVVKMNANEHKNPDDIIAKEKPDVLTEKKELRKTLDVFFPLFSNRKLTFE